MKYVCCRPCTACPVLHQVLLLDCLTKPTAAGPNLQLRTRAEMQQLARNFPKLQHLDLVGRIADEVTAQDQQPLLELQGYLTNLSLGGKHLVADDAMLATLAQLTGLQSLVVVDAWDVTDLGLMALTNLKQLRELHVSGLSSEEEEVSEVLVPKANRAGPRELKLTTKVCTWWHGWADIVGGGSSVPMYAACTR